jgi:hypothetical protein
VERDMAGAVDASLEFDRLAFVDRPGVVEKQ